jgi:hypothetical protein
LPEDVTQLFEEYAARYVRGERPEARLYVERAGAGGDELARLIDAYLQRAPVPAADDATRTMMAAWRAGEAPLVALRAQRGLKRDQVVDALMERLGLDRAKREKLKQRYHQLENGLLDPRRVDGSVWEALAETLRTRASDLVGWRPRPLAAEGAFLRVDAAAPLRAARPAPEEGAPIASAGAREAELGRLEPEPEPDEVDRLFGTV